MSALMLSVYTGMIRPSLPVGTGWINHQDWIGYSICLAVTNTIHKNLSTRRPSPRLRAGCTESLKWDKSPQMGAGASRQRLRQAIQTLTEKDLEQSEDQAVSLCAVRCPLPGGLWA